MIPSDQAFSSAGESRWPFSRPSLAPLARAVTRLPRKAEFTDMFTKHEQLGLRCERGSSRKRG